MSEKPIVYSSDCRDYVYDDVFSVVKNHFDSIIASRYDDYDFCGKTVAVKPNLLAKRTPDACVTTSPVFVRAACTYFLEKGAHVVVCDSPGGVYNASAINSIYTTCGLKDACDQCGAELNQDFSYTEVFNKNGEVSKSFNIINPLYNADFIVNLCRLKTHALCNMSAAVKNLYGAVPGLQKAEQHARFPMQQDFSQYLIDLCLTVKPNISLIDAVIAMEGNGPASGTLKAVGVVLSSDDPFSLDYVASHIMDYTVSEVPTVENAIKRGLCPASLNDITIVGEDIEKYVSHFIRPDSHAGGLIKQLPGLFGGRVRKMLEPRPYVNDDCVGCGECARCCPQKTIHIENQKAHINYDACIRCYCCQELCPKKAIRIKRNLFMKF